MRTALIAALLLLFVLNVLPVARVLADSFLSEDGRPTMENYRSAFAPAYRPRILLHFFKRLAEIPGGSGFEEEVIKAIAAELRKRTPDVSLEPYGQCHREVWIREAIRNDLCSCG